jgi:hypothetical protein
MWITTALRQSIDCPISGFPGEVFVSKAGKKREVDTHSPKTAPPNSLFVRTVNQKTALWVNTA